MGGKEGTSNGPSMDGRGKCLKSELINGFVNNNRDGFLVSSDGLRTYKRRKQTASSSESKDLENGGSGEPAGKLADQEEIPSYSSLHAKTLNSINSFRMLGLMNLKVGSVPSSMTMHRPHDHPASGEAGLTDSNEVSQGHWKNYILEQMHRSLSDDEGGIQRCIQDVLRMSLKVSDACDKDMCKPLKKVWLSNGTPNLAKQNDVRSNGVSDEPNRHTVTDMCRLAFHGIISSEEFTSLCKLLFENFHESRADSLFSPSLINQRMKEGAYEHSPLLFFDDIQQFWKKLEGIGSELIFLAKSLSKVSRTCYEDQLPKQESDSFGNADKAAAEAAVCTCRHCGSKADGRDCLVCDSCEDMYHISCIEPAVEEIPPKNWYCSSCSANGMGSRENCVVCERVSASSILDNEADAAVCQTDEETLSSDFEGPSEESNEDPHQLSEDQGTQTSHACKICGTEVESGGNVKICEHRYCPNMYYHTRCLTAKQRNSHGPRWYCPSCLCRGCLTDKDDDKIVLCDACDSAYHIYCMKPPRTSIPRGRWFCRQCMVKLQKVRRSKRSYEKHTDDRKMAFEEMNKRSKRKIEDVFDGREGIELLVDALFIEDNLAGKQSQG
ncbi:PHD finger protein EHD3 [Linum perenne]